MMNQGAEVDRQRRVLVRAPVGRDGTLTRQILLRASVGHVVCLTLHELVVAFAAGAGALLLSEEALDEAGLEELTHAIDEQPPWSDIPVLLLAGAEHHRVGMRTLERARRLGNVTLLERPLRLAAVLSSVESALRSRTRQYEMREVLVALHDAREQADATSRVKDEFLATLSHELRTPLNAVLGWASMLRSGQVHGPLVARAHEIIERNARAQQALVADLLDVSRIITGKLALTPGPAMVVPLVMAALDTVTSAAEAKRVTLRTHIDAPDAMVFGDQARLQQVFWNLLSNAVKFTPAGGSVDVEVRHDADQIVISVTDNGIGIEPMFLPVVFERFRQADTTTTRLHGGLGLGLAIVRHLVELHGGQIEARSGGAGRGATFVVCLPQVRAATAAMTPLPVESSEEADLHGVRALVVEDDADARELLAVILRDAGVRPSLASGAGEALSLMASGPPFDVVMCDLAVEDQQGYALIAAIRSTLQLRHHSMPVIGFTACSGEPDEARARAAGCTACLVKPIDAYSLTHTIGVVLRHERARAAGRS
jgi:signal transduction histidine kinase/ActR/RegA family two-component response regulator